MGECINTIEDRLHGMFRGLVAGDKIGGPTQMSLQLAKTILADESFKPENIANAYLKWWLEHGFDTGRVARMVFRFRQLGLTNAQATAKTNMELDGLTAGCNPAHRSAPLAAALFLPTHNLALYAFQEATLTHQHPLAGDISAATIILCRKLINGYSWEQAVSLAKETRRSETIQALNFSKFSHLHRSGYAPHVLQAAMHFLHKSNSFGDALSNALAFAGPSNYCPVLVGIIGGARWGAHSIAEQHLFHSKRVNEIDQIAQQFINY